MQRLFAVPAAWYATISVYIPPLSCLSKKYAWPVHIKLKSTLILAHTGAFADAV